MAFNLDLWFKKKIKEELFGNLTDKFLEMLLSGMDLAFAISESYRKNIEGFKGKYLFRTDEGGVAAAAIFENGDMRVGKEEINDWDVRITFKNPAALRSFLFSKNQDIVNSLLKNEVAVDGNLNYIYKFGFMARDLAKRFGAL